jgi:hypothetical protein
MDVHRSSSWEHFVVLSKELVAERRAPVCVRLDNVFEITAQVLRDW